MDCCILCNENRVLYPPHKYAILSIFLLKKILPIELIREVSSFLIHKNCYYLDITSITYDMLNNLIDDNINYSYINTLICSSPLINISVREYDNKKINNFNIKYYNKLKLFSYNENNIPKNIDDRLINRILSLDF